MEEIAVRAPRFQCRFHRRRGDCLIEKTQRRLIGLQFSRHETFFAASSIAKVRPASLPREQRLPETSEQRGRSGIYLDATGLSKQALCEPAAKYADGRDLGLPGRDGIVGCVANRDGVSSFLRTTLKMSGAGFDSSTSSEEVARSTKSAMRAMSRYLSSSSFFAEEAIATRSPASRTRRNRSGTAEKGRTSGRYSVTIAAPLLQFFAVVSLLGRRIGRRE